MKVIISIIINLFIADIKRLVSYPELPIKESFFNPSRKDITDCTQENIYHLGRPFDPG